MLNSPTILVLLSILFPVENITIISRILPNHNSAEEILYKPKKSNSFAFNFLDKSNRKMPNTKLNEKLIKIVITLIQPISESVIKYHPLKYYV